jgi:hypothetical protein
MLLSGPPRSGIQRLLINSDAAAIAATARARAAWAAAFGGVRGDLWAESAFTYATLLSPVRCWPIYDREPCPHGHLKSARVRPLQIRRLASRREARIPNWTNANPIAILKMSYYTGLNELNLIPLRQFTATHSNALA